MKQTIEDLKNLGFNCDNFVICSHPASVVDLVTKQQAIPVTCSECGYDHYKNRVIQVIHRMKTVTPELIKKINDSKMVSVWLPNLSDRTNVISCSILDDELYD